MGTELIDLGAGAIVAILIVREFIAFQKLRKKSQELFTHDLIKKINDLHKWHDTRDVDGLPIWYVTSDLKNKVTSIDKKLTRLLQEARGLAESLRKGG